MPIAWRAGPHVQGTHLWCDAARARGVCVLTRADAPGGGESLIATAMTARLRKALGARGEVLPARCGHPFTVGPARIELFPSAALPGAASALFEVGDERMVYTGAVGAGAEQRLCDTLCLHAPAETRPLDVAAAARAAIERGATPVLLAPGLAEAIAACGALAAAGIAVRALRRWIAAFELLGARARPFRGTPRPGEAVLWPLAARRAPAVARLPATHAIALPETAAAGERLVDYARATGARTVLALGPGAAALVARLRARGLDARPLRPRPEQLALFAGGAAATC